MTDAIPNYDEPEQPIRVGNFLILESTGEIVAVAAKKDPSWQPKTLSDADFVMELMLDATFDLEAVAAKRKMLLETLALEEERRKRRLDWLKGRFGPALQAIAERELAGKKARSVKTSFGGFFGWRKQPTRFVVDDEARAKETFPEAVKVEETFLPSLLTEDQRKALEFLEIAHTEGGQDEFRITPRPKA